MTVTRRLLYQCIIWINRIFLSIFFFQSESFNFFFCFRIEILERTIFFARILKFDAFCVFFAIQIFYLIFHTYNWYFFKIGRSVQSKNLFDSTLTAS